MSASRNYIVLGIAVLIVAIIAVLAWWLTYGKGEYERELTRAAIEQEIEQAAYCETDNDCTVIYAPCPFGCHAAVNTNEAERISSLMESYPSTCIYSCIQAPPVRCIENACTLDTPEPGGG